MALALNRNPAANLLAVELSGTMAHGDYERVLSEAEDMARQHAEVRVLFDLEEFHGWEADAMHDDTPSGARQLSEIGRVALVGSKMWESAMTRLGRVFPRAKIRHFDVSQRGEARLWLGQE